MRNSAETNRGDRSYGFVIALLIVAIILIYRYYPTLKEYVLPNIGVTNEEDTAPEPIKDMLSASEPYEIVKRDHPCYAYEQLSDEYKQIYDEIYSICRNRDEKVLLSNHQLTVEEIGRIARDYVLRDNPELFYADGYDIRSYDMGNAGTYYYFSGRYTMSKEEIAYYEPLVAERTAEILALLPPDADEYTIAKTVYEYIINNTNYLTDCPQNQNILSVLINNCSVCAGYAATYQYLLQKCGMTAFVVTSDKHAWNLVKVDGDYYYVDTTWGDPNFLTEEGRTQKDGYVDYSYLLFTDDELAFGLEKRGNIKPNVLRILPKCTAKKDNYFVKEGLYYDDVDTEILGEKLLEVYEAGGYFTVRFSNNEAYDTYIECLADYSVFKPLLKKYDVKGYSYVTNADFLTVTVEIP